MMNTHMSLNRCKKPNHLVGYILILSLLLMTLAGCGSSDDENSSTVTNEPTAAPTAYTAENPARVLIIHSYHPEYLWEQELSTGIITGLAESGFSSDAGNLVLDYFWMDTKRQTSETYMQQISQEAVVYIKNTDPDLVIATDDNAFRLVVRVWQDQSPPFVVAGLNGRETDYNTADLTNVAGVLEQVHFQETMGWIKRVFPNAQKVILLSDQSATSIALIPNYQTAALHAGFIPSNLTAQSFAQFQQYAESAFERGDVLLIAQYHTLLDDQDKVVDSKTVIDWLIENSPIPVVAIWEFSVQEGALGGSVISGETQGNEAGKAAARILNGESPQSIGFVTPKRGKLTINWAAAQRWGVTFPLDLLEVSQLYESGVVNR
jgi:ABC-type uncharacterized transport system substrate-binding protein